MNNEIQAEWKRSIKSLSAAETLLENEFNEDAISRAIRRFVVGEASEHITLFYTPQKPRCFRKMSRLPAILRLSDCLDFILSEVD